jgi:hypothetical protein
MVYLISILGFYSGSLDLYQIGDGSIGQDLLHPLLDDARERSQSNLSKSVGRSA